MPVKGSIYPGMEHGKKKMKKGKKGKKRRINPDKKRMGRPF